MDAFHFALKVTLRDNRAVPIYYRLQSIADRGSQSQESYR
jgi:hypothetical protein